ncbi:MAG: GtrA family protein [Bacteroidales bacterium]|nr:GtrA family protein [Bacteroidales bacterium]
MKYKSAIKEFVFPKVKFALTSSVATAVDYGIYIFITVGLSANESLAHAISYTVAMILNFLLQKKFIFTSMRRTSTIFILSVSFSLIGWLLSQGVFNLLIHSISFFNHYDILAKLLTTAIIFLYNFYTKRYAFEKKIPLQNARRHLQQNKNEEQ